EGPRYLLSVTPGRVNRTAPDYGQDNEYVLTELLGYTPDEVRDLTDRGVLRYQWVFPVRRTAREGDVRALGPPTIRRFLGMPSRWPWPKLPAARSPRRSL